MLFSLPSVFHPAFLIEGGPELFQGRMALPDPVAKADGVIPRLLGFDLVESTVLPASSAAPNGFIVHPAALAVATRAVVPSDPKGYLDQRTVTDPDTGITMSYRRHYASGAGKHFLTFECYYGAAVGLKDALVLMPAIPAASGS